MSITFELRDSFKDFAGGTVFVDDKRNGFDVLGALDAGNGSIEVEEDDLNLISAMSNYAPLKRGKNKPDPEPVSADEGVADADNPKGKN